MLKRIMQFIASALLTLTAGTDATAQTLKFDTRGEFKIVQFTDLHYQSRNPRSATALECIDAVVGTERPDLVVFTGDNIYARPADTAMTHIVDRIERHGVPYVILFGNHDHEQGMTLAQLYDIIRRGRHCLQPDRGSVESPDYVLEIAGSKSSAPAALLYCLDSHSYPATKRLGTYAWLTLDQVQWYRERSRAYTAANGGRPLPALSFFHIPLPEFAQAAATEANVLIGTRMEKSCPPLLNSGMFCAMREGGDVMGIFCGHDHDNDYTTLYHDILLGYGRFSGGNTEYNHLPVGARVIVLHEGQRRFDTWIRTLKGDRQNVTIYPDSYVKDDWRKRPVEKKR